MDGDMVMHMKVDLRLQIKYDIHQNNLTLPARIFDINSHKYCGQMRAEYKIEIIGMSLY